MGTAQEKTWPAAQHGRSGGIGRVRSEAGEGTGPIFLLNYLCNCNQGSPCLTVGSRRTAYAYVLFSTTGPAASPVHTERKLLELILVVHLASCLWTLLAALPPLAPCSTGPDTSDRAPLKPLAPSRQTLIPKACRHGDSNAGTQPQMPSASKSRGRK